MIGFYFSGQGGAIQVPVNPDELEIKWLGSNKKTEIVALGEINLLRDPRLASIVLTLLFPGHAGYSFVVGAWRPPEELVRYFRAAMTSKAPLRLTVSEIDLAMRVSVESVESTRSAGDHDSLLCKVALSEWRSYSAKRIYRPDAAKAPMVAATERPVDKPPSLIHTVVKNDTLWAIAKKELGSGTRYPEIAALNPQIKNPNRIYPGQVLQLPSR